MVSIFSYRSVHGCMWTVAPARLASSASPIRKIELLGIVTIVQTYGDIRTDARFFLSTTSTTTTLPCGIVWYPGLERPHESVAFIIICYPCALKWSTVAHAFATFIIDIHWSVLVDAFQRLSSLKATSSPGWGVLSRCWYPWTPWFWFPYLHLGSCVSQAPSNKL